MKRAVAMMLIVASVLSGCVAAVVAGAAAGVIVYDRRSLSMLEADARIFHLLHKQIVTDSRIRDAHVEVVSFNRIVLLVGETRDPSTRQLVERMAQQTPNVRRVYDEITIANPISVAQHSKDALITGQVKTQMLAHRGLESGSIKIVTENAVVFLMGITTPEEADIAVNIARQTRGVEKVVKVFQYIH